MSVSLGTVYDIMVYTKKNRDLKTTPPPRETSPDKDRPELPRSAIASGVTNFLGTAGFFGNTWSPVVPLDLVAVWGLGS